MVLEEFLFFIVLQIAHLAPIIRLTGSDPRYPALHTCQSAVKRNNLSQPATLLPVLYRLIETKRSFFRNHLFNSLIFGKIDANFFFVFYYSLGEDLIRFRK